jgi:aryl-alcohol dehydrogenase-like predicted oxidoreductase
MLLGRVGRMGFGAMQLPGPGVFGPPRDRDEAIAVLRRVIELGIDHIDTAQYYGPDVANELIHAALHPYPDGLVIVSKVGARRDETGGWHDAGAPDELRAGVEDNLRSLELEQIPVVNLRILGTDRFDDQLATMIAMREEGKVGAVGISNVSKDEFDRAVGGAEIACVQNAYSVANRTGADVLAGCEDRGIAFVPFFPLGSGFPGANPVLDNEDVRSVAARLGVTPAQAALAWLLGHSPNVLLIPGTSSLEHLEENVAAADITLDEDDRVLLDGLAG